MNQLSIRLSIISSLIIAALTNLVTVAIPAEMVSITVSPMATITQIKGAQARANFSVTNHGQSAIRTRIYAQDFDYDSEKGYVKIASHAQSATPYLQFSPKELVVLPGVTREVRLNITIPPSKPDGEYRVAIFTEDLTERKIVDAKSKYITIIRPQIGSIFFIAKGKVTPQLSAVSVEWNPISNRPHLLLKNQGQASAYSNIDWKLMQGDVEVASHNIHGIVLQAGRERGVDLEISSTAPLTAGNYTLVGEIDNKDGKVVPFSLGINIPLK